MFSLSVVSPACPPFCPQREPRQSGRLGRVGNPPRRKPPHLLETSEPPIHRSVPPPPPCVPEKQFDTDPTFVCSHERGQRFVVKSHLRCRGCPWCDGRRMRRKLRIPTTGGPKCRVHVVYELITGIFYIHNRVPTRPRRKATQGLCVSFSRIGIFPGQPGAHSENFGAPPFGSLVLHRGQGSDECP